MVQIIAGCAKKPRGDISNSPRGYAISLQRTMDLKNGTFRPAAEREERLLENEPDIESESELVASARRSDPHAMERLIRRYQDKVYRLAYSMMSADEDEALDLTQEVFLAVFRNIRRYKGKSSFYTWLFRIAVNTCLDARRRRRRWKRIFSFWPPAASTQSGDLQLIIEDVPEPNNTSSPLLALDRKELYMQVEKALKGLSPKQRLVFHMKIFQEMTIAEIAEIMSLAEGTVKSHLFRATRLLRQSLSSGDAFPWR